MVSVAPRSRISGTTKIDPKMVSKSPITIAVKNPVLAAQVALSSSFAPRCRDTIVPEPIPSVKPTAWIIAIRENTIPTAPTALVPSWDTKKVSAIL